MVPLVFAVLAIGVGLAPAPDRGVVRRVPSEYGTINAALDASSAGDTVLVAPGRYTDSEVRDLGDLFPWRSCAFMRDGVVLASEAGPQLTTIDMDGVSAAQPEVILLRRGVPNAPSVVGFTVTGAPLAGRGAYVIGAIFFRDCLFRDMDAGGSTGAGVAANGDVRFERCEFVNCVATQGGSAGAIYHANGHLDLIDTTIRQCGPIAVRLNGNGSPPPESALIEDCRFLDNWAVNVGAALWVSDFGGGVTVRGCRFERNVAHGSGGGAIAAGNFGPKTIEGCLFVENGTDGDNGQGGAINIAGTGTCAIRGNTFYGNYQTYHGIGGSALCIRCDTSLERNAIVASTGHVALYVEPGFTLSRNCNLYWDNPQGIGLPLAPTEIEADPYFCGVDSGDFTVREDSPCLPEHSNGCEQIGAFGVGCEKLAVEQNSWARTKNLYRGGNKP